MIFVLASIELLEKNSFKKKIILRPVEQSEHDMSVTEKAGF
jgi:hypothetical protein